MLPAGSRCSSRLIPTFPIHLLQALGRGVPCRKLWQKGQGRAAGSRGSSGPSKGKGKLSTKGQNCPPERLGTTFHIDIGPCLPSWRLWWVPETPHGWSPHGPLHTSRPASVFPLLRRLPLWAGSAWPSHPPAGAHATCSLSYGREPLLPPEDTSPPERLSQGLGVCHARGFTPAVSRYAADAL